MHPDANLTQYPYTLRRCHAVVLGAGTQTARGKPPAKAAVPTIVRDATRVERLGYTRTQAAEALGISRSTFNRRVLPIIETIEMPWGTRLVPVGELERLVAQRRQPAPSRAQPRRQGRAAATPPPIEERSRAAHAAGYSLGQIARSLDADARSSPGEA